MHIRRRNVFVFLAFSAGIFAWRSGQAAQVASPRSSVPVNISEFPASALSIPDTTSAINSSAPMSQRVVHYEIDAKYDPTKHTVDASEILTYHNLTGQPLDHFPFHLYQNAFQPKSTWIREAKIE